MYVENYKFPLVKFTSVPSRQSVFDHHEQMLNKFFDDFWGNRKNFIHSNTSYPKMDIFESEDYFYIDCAVPGVKEDNLQIEIVKESKLLTIKGKSNVLRIDKYNEHLKELKHSAFTRTVQLPDYVELDAEEVTLQDGILYMAFKKIVPPEQHKEETIKKIQIKKS